jgi:hypothetical protein
LFFLGRFQTPLNKFKISTPISAAKPRDEEDTWFESTGEGKIQINSENTRVT